MKKVRNPNQDPRVRNTKRNITIVLRVALGLLFVFSGLVKLNDPWGLAFKMQEYFAVFGLGFFEDFALQLSMGAICLEIVLGVILLLGRFKVFALWSLMVLNIGFAFLTFYSAYFGVVQDCGCFGDAIQMSPWSSFYKNVAILVVLMLLIVWQRFIKPNAGFRTAMSIVAVVFAVSLGIASHVLNNEPIIDFRPYKVGVNIPEASLIPEGAQLPEYENIWIYSVNGVNKRFTDTDQPWDIEGAEYVDRDTRLVKEGYVPQITNFSIVSDQQGDITDQVLAMDKVYLIISPSVEKSKIDDWNSIKKWLSSLPENAKVILLSGSSKAPQGIDVPVYHTDPIVLKTIIRSNPAVVLLEDGIIKVKYTHHNIGVYNK